MSVKPSAKVVPLSNKARRAKRGHQTARKTAISKLDQRVAQLEAVVAALDQRFTRGAFNRPFQVALSVSILLHLLVITLVTFTVPDKNTVTNNQPLEVILVNAKSKTKPPKAQALAQHNLDGGGNTDADRRARSPLPVLRSDPFSSDVAVAQKRVEQLEQEVRQVMTQSKSAFAVASAPAQPVPQVQPQPDAPPSLTQMDILRKLNIQRLEAEIAKQWDAYQKRPRRHTMGASASEYRFARYVEDWRLKVERIGEANYPQAARDQKIYGSLLLIVSIKSDGSVENIEMRRSSGNKILDDAAIRIVRMGAPYAAFPADIARDTDIIDISRTWRFTSSDRLETE
jgi:protein TonB